MALSFKNKPSLPVAVTKPTPYTFDLGLLLAIDANPITSAASINGSISLSAASTIAGVADADADADATTPPSSTEQVLAETARDGAQALINQLLTTCTVTSTPTGVVLSLPPPSTLLPREKPVPEAKPPTTWQKFAAKRGIKPKQRSALDNKKHDDATGEWTARWGHKKRFHERKTKADWLIEVDPRKEAERAKGTTVRGDLKRERKENVRRNKRKMRKNQRAAEMSKNK